MLGNESSRTRVWIPSWVSKHRIDSSLVNVESHISTNLSWTRMFSRYWVTQWVNTPSENNSAAIWTRQDKIKFSKMLVREILQCFEHRDSIQLLPFPLLLPCVKIIWLSSSWSSDFSSANFVLLFFTIEATSDKARRSLATSRNFSAPSLI